MPTTPLSGPAADAIAEAVLRRNHSSTANLIVGITDQSTRETVHQLAMAFARALQRREAVTAAKAVVPPPTPITAKPNGGLNGHKVYDPAPQVEVKPVKPAKAASKPQEGTSEPAPEPASKSVQ